MTNEPDFKKAVDGLLPAIIQDDHTGKVLMQGYMNKESFQKTLDEKVVWFYSRSKQRLWKKGETSGNELQVSTVRLDCDLDSILIKVIPLGPVCHTGVDTCFNEINTVSYDWIKHLEAIIEQRQKALFLQTARALNLQLADPQQIDGFNISKGRNVSIFLYRTDMFDAKAPKG